MNPYVTPGQFKMLGTGADLTGITDQELYAILEAASLRVNRYCNAPRTPRPHDFRGDVIGGEATPNYEKHQWDVGSMFRVGSDRVYPYHYPVKSVQTFQLRVTVNQTVDFEPIDIYINNSENYMEVISLANRLSVFTAGYVPALGLRTPVAEVAYTYGYSFPLTGDTLYLDPNATTSGTYRATNGWWDDTQTITVYEDGVATASGGNFTVDVDEGTVTFTSPPAASVVVTADYTYKLPTEIARATALVAADLISRRFLQTSGLMGVSGLHVEETQVQLQDQMGGSAAGMRRPPSPLFDDTITGPAAELLNTYVFRSWG